MGLRLHGRAHPGHEGTAVAQRRRTLTDPTSRGGENIRHTLEMTLLTHIATSCYWNLYVSLGRSFGPGKRSFASWGGSKRRTPATAWTASLTKMAGGSTHAA